MTDIRQILPSFPVAKFASILPAIEQNALTTTELLTLHPADIAKQTHLPLLDLKRFIAVITGCLSDDLHPEIVPLSSSSEDEPSPSPESASSSTWPALISTLDDDLDAALGGGIPTGRITEFAGESGAGKTQFLLSLCLAVQLPPGRGITKQALYISTESSLSTSRLSQMMKNHPVLKAVDFADRPSLDNILSTSLPDLESQDHILQYQLPVLLERHNIGLIVLDSVAANYRAEFERHGTTHGSNMAARSSDLIKLGALLRHLARTHNLAVIVANQVADRFSSSSSSSTFPTSTPFPSTMRPPQSSFPSQATQETPLASRSIHRGQPILPPSSPPPFSIPPDDDGTNGPPPPPVLRLDHQQRWFTGWGDDPAASHALKTPSLGMVWSTQIACRVALFKHPVYGRARHVAPPASTAAAANHDGEDDEGAVAAGPTRRTWRRWMKVVFAPHAAPSGQGLDDAVEFDITLGGLKAVRPKMKDAGS